MADDPTESSILTAFGTTRRTHRWHLTQELTTTTVLGSATFDLREVDADATEVDISITCVLGRVEFIVPPGTSVSLDGPSYVASAWSDISDNPDDSPSHLPRLNVTARTILGRVRICTPDRRPVRRRDRKRGIDPAVATDDHAPAPEAPATEALSIGEAPATEAHAPAPEAPETEALSIGEAPATEEAPTIAAVPNDEAVPSTDTETTDATTGSTDTEAPTESAA
ncbi:MAG: hypothetical protein ACE5GB_03165 [Acidimicrobiales bacterium]